MRTEKKESPYRSIDLSSDYSFYHSLIINVWPISKLATQDAHSSAFKRLIPLKCNPRLSWKYRERESSYYYINKLLIFNVTHSQIISDINTSKWKSFSNLYQNIKSKYPSITSKHIRSLIKDKITRDLKSPIKLKSKYYNKVSSNLRHSDQKDIFVNDTKHERTFYPYYLVMKTSTQDTQYLIICTIEPKR
ncbi:MAG: hypothetical protein Ta2E_11690 [Mycoplasmoidaceae bacterium]|nr:MAG: hypothetical protein Ta2E_11690 [Mycoplasmoidaceae bacterium]